MKTIINCATGEITVIPPTQEEILEEAWLLLRSERNNLLRASDWTQIANAPVNQVAWETYRQSLRDLPANTIDPLNPVWPAKP